MGFIGYQGNFAPYRVATSPALTLQQTDNHADDVMRLIAKTLKEGKPSRPWSERILLGFWIVSAREEAIFHVHN